MNNILSIAARRALGMERQQPKEPQAQLRIGHIIEVVDEPPLRSNDIVDIIERGMSGKRPPNTWLSRRKRQSLVSADIDGKMTYRGRACCFEHLIRAEEQLAHRHDLPFETTCPGCDTIYRIRRGVTASR